jgi:DNA (cytosine-5)-methyltransferase 1
MPIETTRLQGFPRGWHDLAPFDGDVAFWENVRKTYANIMGTRYTPMKDAASLERWYYKLRNDASEYKADGNSLAIPCAAYVIKRIVDCVTNVTRRDDQSAKQE